VNLYSALLNVWYEANHTKVCQVSHCRLSWACPGSPGSAEGMFLHQISQVVCLYLTKSLHGASAHFYAQWTHAWSMRKIFNRLHYICSIAIYNRCHKNKKHTCVVWTGTDYSSQFMMVRSPSYRSCHIVSTKQIILYTARICDNGKQWYLYTLLRGVNERRHPSPPLPSDWVLYM